jgi:DNA-binding NarL/FixJ family response regulator
MVESLVAIDSTAVSVLHVVIVDDHALVGSALRLLLGTEDDVAVEGVAVGTEAGVRMTRLHKPDIVVLDVAMPELGGFDTVRAIKRAAPRAAILVLSMRDDQRHVRDAFAAGASGYLLKEAVATDLVTAIHEVVAGRAYLHPLLGARLAYAQANAATRAAADPLSEREREVARLLALGHTNREISTMLSISVRTTETHRAHIMRKLKISTRSDLVRYALRNGFLESAEPQPA